MKSYDRFFPNQDTLPRGGFGNLIAMPLQYEPRQAGNSVFLVDLIAILPFYLTMLFSIDRRHEPDFLFFQ